MKSWMILINKLPYHKFDYIMFSLKDDNTGTNNRLEAFSQWNWLLGKLLSIILYEPFFLSKKFLLAAAMFPAVNQDSYSNL